MLQGSERTLLQQRCHKAYLSGNKKVTRDCAQDNNVTRLGEITLANNMARLREIALSMTMLQGLSLLQQRGCNDWRYCVRNNNGSRLIAPLTTTLERSHSQRILQGSERLRLHQRCCKAYFPCNNKVARIGEIVLATLMGQGVLLLL